MTAKKGIMKAVKKTTKPEAAAGQVEVGPAPIYLIDIVTKTGGKVQMQTFDPKAGQALVEAIVLKGTYTFEVEGGVQTISVDTAKITGPYEKKSEATTEVKQ